MRTVAPEGTTMGEIYRAIVPFVVLQAIGLVIVILFPDLALLIPSRMIK
jgi:TRAP-type mannitol/chloroaromatic compound transport system permease large subunit